MALRPVKIKEYTKGVFVSPNPRNIPFVTNQRVAAGVPRARIRKYETAECHMGDAASTPMPNVMPLAKTA